MTEEAKDEPRTYFGWQGEKVAFIFGLSGRRAALLGGAVLAATWPLAVSRAGLGAVCWPIAGLLLIAALARIAGRTLDEWAASALSYALLRIRDRHKFLSGAFAPRADAPDEPAPMDLPGILAPIEILQARSRVDGRALAIAHHRLDRTYTAVARVRVPGIGLVDSTRRDLRVSAWGGLLSGLCTEGNAIVRVQALQRLVPKSGAALRRWHELHADTDAPEVATEVTDALLATATLATSHRESVLAFTLDHRRAAAQIKAAGGGTGGAATVLVRQLTALTSAMRGADLQVEGWLSPRDLAEALRTAYDPHSVRSLADERATATATTASGGRPPGEPGVDPALAGPAAAEALPGSYRHDGAHSVTYVVHDWPRNQIYSTALAPLLGEGAHRRAFSLYVEPLGPRRAEQEVMRERTARDVAIRMRQRSGQVIPEHEQAALDRARAQDRERAAGHGLVRFAAYVTVTVTDPDLLDDACAALEADAAAARISIRRIWMAQDIGFALGALPLGMGLPRKRW